MFPEPRSVTDGREHDPERPSRRAARRRPAHAEADGIDLGAVRRGAVVHVFEGRCPHRARCWPTAACSLAVAVALRPRMSRTRCRRDPVYCARVLVADTEVVARLRAGDEAVFAQVVRAWSPAMLRVARAHVHSHATAEEVVQETWLGVLRALDGSRAAPSADLGVPDPRQHRSPPRQARGPERSCRPHSRSGPVPGRRRARLAAPPARRGRPDRHHPSPRCSPASSMMCRRPHSASCPSACGPSSSCATSTASTRRRCASCST